MTPRLAGRSRISFLRNSNNALFMLMIVCALGFIAVNFVKIGYFLSGGDMAAYRDNFLNWLLVPANPLRLIERPWSVFTHMFIHEGVWHLISNMLWLWVFGFILQDLTGGKEVVPIYVYGGLAGALAFCLTVNGFSVLRSQIDGISPLMGAGAAIMAIAVATTTLAPTYKLLPMLHGGIPLWVLTLIFGILDFATIAGAGAGIGVAHLAGGLIGFAYMKAYQRGQNWGAWMHKVNEWIGGLFEPSVEKEQQAARIRQEVFYETKGQQPFQKKANLTQQRVDELLDKISQKGYNHLTEEEKEYLKRASNEDI